MNKPTPNPFPKLIAEDAAALEAFAGQGFIGAGMNNTDSRTAQLIHLLSLLDTGLETGNDAEKQVLVDVVMARVLRTKRSDVVACLDTSDSPALLTDDSEALESLVDARWSAQPTSDVRARRAAELVALLDENSPIEDTGLVSATLGRIEKHVEAQRARMRLDADTQPAHPRSLGVHLADLASVAAVVLIGAAILWPMLAGLREKARIEGGQANLSRSAIGFTLYAADHKGQLPQAQASLFGGGGGGGKWWNVGEPKSSHSANLFTLARQGYASLYDLSSPGNPAAPVRFAPGMTNDWRLPEEVSFSYQLFIIPPLWGGNGGRTVVLTDKSPVVARSRVGERAEVSQTSLNHPGWGQNVLFDDASVRFYTTPVLESGDHLWVPATLEFGQRSVTLKGDERPASSRDAFVGP